MQKFGDGVVGVCVVCFLFVESDVVWTTVLRTLTVATVGTWQITP